MTKNTQVFNFVLPSFKISGGIKEVITISDELKILGANTLTYVMWVSPSEIAPVPPNSVYLSKYIANAKIAIFQLACILIKFLSIDRAKRFDEKWIFTHYSTLPLAFWVPSDKRIFLVQGVEWEFIRNKFISRILKKFILFFYRRGQIVTTNRYLSTKMVESGLVVAAESEIWADMSFYTESDVNRDIDIVMMLRGGDAKRLDMYCDFIKYNYARKNPRIIAVITPDDFIADLVGDLVSECHTRLSIDDMKSLYARSRVFLMLSEHEGFGLPPLEAMGAGCVPICRDSGGVRAYMTGDLSDLVVPLDWSLRKIIDLSDLLLNDGRLEFLSRVSRKVFKSGLIPPSARGRLFLDLR
jgi:glycosyltransferase involved in cell wall biosynthesis